METPPGVDDRTGELSLYSIALLSKQQKLDMLYLRERAKEKIDAWEKTKKKKGKGGWRASGRCKPAGA